MSRNPLETHRMLRRVSEALDGEEVRSFGHYDQTVLEKQMQMNRVSPPDADWTNIRNTRDVGNDSLRDLERLGVGRDPSLQGEEVPRKVYDAMYGWSQRSTMHRVARYNASDVYSAFLVDQRSDERSSSDAYTPQDEAPF